MVLIGHTRLIIIFTICVGLFVLRHLLIRGFIYGPTPKPKYLLGWPVVVTVFYEALCSDSKHFIIKQLLPAYKQAAPLMAIKLVPYGKAQTFIHTDGTYRFECQHGNVECEGNMYHACVIENFDNDEVRLDMIACMIRDNRNPKEAMLKCASQYNIGRKSIDSIQNCISSGHGRELLKMNGDDTHALRPPVSFIPTITLDGDQRLQPAILKDLLGEICNLFGDIEKTKEYCTPEDKR